MIGSNANSLPKLKVALILPGLGRVHRGAETGFLELARNLGKFDDLDVQCYGSGANVPAGVKIRTVPVVPRERFEGFPKFPVLRSENEYEEFSFIMSLMLRKRVELRKFDVALHCSFPFTNWFLQRLEKRGGPKPIFVTQNGDWAARADSREYRSFRCAGLVATKPEFHDRHRDRYRTALIPNGVDPAIFRPRSEVAGYERDVRIPKDLKAVLMVSAFIPSKRVLDGIRAAALVPNAFLILAGDGPERQQVAELAERELPGRHLLLGSVHRDQMSHWFRQADAFLHMSQDESFGIVYLEAAASGLAQVVHKSETTEWILGDTAIAVDSGNVADVASGLQRALEVGAARRLGQAARARVLADWTWDIQAAKYREFFYSCSRRGEGTSCSRLSSSTSTPASIFASA